MRKKNDALLKAAFEETFLYLLRFFFANADETFDYSRGFTFMDKELREIFPEIENVGGSRYVDMLVKVFLMDGSEKWILVHIEIQDQHKLDFPRRMFRYFYRIYDRFGVGITAIAVFTGRTKNGKTEFIESLLGTRILYQYNTYHIFDHTEDELLTMNNPFALVVVAAQKAAMAERIPQEELGETRLTIAKALIQSGQFTHSQIEGFLIFLKSFLRIDSTEINAIFDKQTEILTGKKNAMGIIETIKMLEREEGIEEGKSERDYKFVSNLILQTDFSPAKIASLANVTEAFVEKVLATLK